MRLKNKSQVLMSTLVLFALSTFSIIWFLPVRVLSRFRIGLVINEGIQRSIYNVIRKVKVGNDFIYFHVVNRITQLRALTLMTKEPDTISWLRMLDCQDVLMDVGANIGVYTLFAAKCTDAKIIAIEPSFRNLDLLQRNLSLNKLQSRVLVAPFALGSANHVGTFLLSQNGQQIGGALNTIVTHRHTSLNTSEYLQSQTLVFTASELISTFGLPTPTFVKIDVDGNELDVLHGFGDLLRDVKSVLIEVDQLQMKDGSAIEALLSSYGFMKQDLINGIRTRENQIWLRRNT